jgi:carboxypeptidase family protein/TonB-dependent receptor-like protein
MCDSKSDQYRRVFLALTFAAAVVLLPAIVSAQTVTGTLQGTVNDTKGAVVPGVDIVVTNVETAQERNLRTNSDGSYTASFLPLGRYKIKASAQGFSASTKEDIEITLNETRVVDFTLNPSGVTEAVLITSEAAQINTTNAEIKGSLNSQEILNKPTLNQSNFLTLAETFSGFQENPTSGQNNPTLSSGSSINFNGTGTRGATFQINGVNNDDSSENQNRQGASLSTIKEFQVITNNFTAEFGRGFGAVVLVQTKSGTNQLHGDVYLYHNDSALNARSSFFSHAGTKPVNRRNQFGFTSGFPLYKNRLFGFVSLDHTESTGAQVFTKDVFLAGERNPANWFLQTPANNTPANRAFIQSIIDRYPASLVPNDPRSNRTFVGQQGLASPARDYSGRFDWTPREADTIFGRWQYTRQRFNPEDIIIGEQVVQNNKQQNFGLTWTHLFNQSLVGEFRYGLGLRTTLASIVAGSDTPVIRFVGSPVAGAIIGNAAAFPIQRYQTDNQYVYNVSVAKGNHFIKTGTDIRRQNLDDFADNTSRGFWNFGATCNGINYVTSYNAFLNGCITTFQKGYGPFFLENRINESNFYVEDNWKIRPNLTLNIGARYEYVSVPKEAKGRITYGFSDDKDNIEPRVGFAWSPRFEGGFLERLFGEPGDSSIRGGYGMYHGRLFQSVFSQQGAGIRFNPPQALFYNMTGTTTTLFTPNNLSDPTNGFVFVPGPQATRHSISIPDPDLEMPYTQQWNLSYERQLPLKSALRISYTGNRGIGLLRFAQGNLPVHDPVNGVFVANHPNNTAALRGQVIRLAANAQCAGTAGTTAIPFTAQCPVVVPIGPLEYSVRVPRTNERRPDPRYTTNLIMYNGSWSYYHGLQAEWIKRLSRNLSFQMTYTWSKSIDTNSEATFVGTGDTNQTGNNTRDSRGLSRFHTPHRFTLFGTYTIPKLSEGGWFDSGGLRLNRFFEDWTISTVLKLASGTPFTITSTGFDDINFDGFIEARPVILDPSILGRQIDDPATSTTLLPTSAFRRPTVNDYGCCIVGRNTFFADSLKRVDFGISRFFRMPYSESHRLNLRADLFNVFNTVQLGFPNPDVTTATFGRITGFNSTYTPRTIQLSLRYQY